MGGNEAPTKLIAVTMMMKKPSSGVVNVDNINSLNSPAHVNHFTETGCWIDKRKLSDQLGKKKTGKWMKTENEGNPPHSTLDKLNQYDVSRDRILNKRYADANELQIKFRFTTESQSNFKKHKLTPSGKKF